MLPTVWTETAIHDVETLMAYLRERNPHAARRIRNLIVETAVGLGQQPYAYREGREPGTREAVVHPNYILIYKVELSAVRVVRVLHASQQYP